MITHREITIITKSNNLTYRVYLKIEVGLSVQKLYLLESIEITKLVKPIYKQAFTNRIIKSSTSSEMEQCPINKINELTKLRSQFYVSSALGQDCYRVFTVLMSWVSVLCIYYFNSLLVSKLFEAVCVTNVLLIIFIQGTIKLIPLRVFRSSNNHLRKEYKTNQIHQLIFSYTRSPFLFVEEGVYKLSLFNVLINYCNI